MQVPYTAIYYSLFFSEETREQIFSVGVPSVGSGTSRMGEGLKGCLLKTLLKGLFMGICHSETFVCPSVNSIFSATLFSDSGVFVQLLLREESLSGSFLV